MQSWTGKFVCLSCKDVTRVPCTIAEREALVEAGLGEKRVTVASISCSYEDFKDTIVAAFTKLKDCGGFDFLRCVANTKQLEAISPTVAQSPKLLKNVIGNGRIFIRSIQQNLSLDPEIELTSPIQVKLYACTVCI